MLGMQNCQVTGLLARRPIGENAERGICIRFMAAAQYNRKSGDDFV
jgi:hypothetical protein